MMGSIERPDNSLGKSGIIVRYGRATMSPNLRCFFQLICRVIVVVVYENNNTRHIVWLVRSVPQKQRKQFYTAPALA